MKLAYALVMLATVVKGAPLHEDRLLSSLLAIEDNPWHAPGGGYGFKPSTWKQHTRMSYAKSHEVEPSYNVAKRHLAWLRQGLKAAGWPVNHYTLAVCWRHGLEGGMAAMRRGRDDYGERTANLYASTHHLKSPRDP